MWRAADVNVFHFKSQTRFNKYFNFRFHANLFDPSIDYTPASSKCELSLYYYIIFCILHHLTFSFAFSPKKLTHEQTNANSVKWQSKKKKVCFVAKWPDVGETRLIFTIYSATACVLGLKEIEMEAAEAGVMSQVFFHFSMTCLPEDFFSFFCKLLLIFLKHSQMEHHHNDRSELKTIVHCKPWQRAGGSWVYISLFSLCLSVPAVHCRAAV